MNWTGRLYEAMLQKPSAMALWTPHSKIVTFGELASLTRRMQHFLRRKGIVRGDRILVLDRPGPHLYAALTAMVCLGATAVFVEPWMPVDRINATIALIKPKAFWAPRLGQIWALRLNAIRQIPLWLRPSQASHDTDREAFHIENMQLDEHALISFSSGTSGIPKGIPRTHGFLYAVDAIFRKTDLNPDPKPDLSIFPNIVLYQIGRGRGTLLVPPAWKRKDLQMMSQLPDHLQPESFSGGPAFLSKMIDIDGFPNLRFVGVGGALSDCPLIERALKRFSYADMHMIYGSTEVEPVCMTDAKLALKQSQARAYFQVLSLGQPLDEVESQFTSEGLWVSGPHVCPEYITAGEQDKLLKKRDSTGKLWHFMGDRINSDAEGYWYAGRSFQNPADFQLEQTIYQHLQRSNCFVTRDAQNRIVLIGEHIQDEEPQLRAHFSNIERFIDAPIKRDRRHRARIDRQAIVAGLDSQMKHLP